jgi:hypothetical protein
MLDELEFEWEQDVFQGRKRNSSQCFLTEWVLTFSCLDSDDCPWFTSASVPYPH